MRGVVRTARNVVTRPVASDLALAGILAAACVVGVGFLDPSSAVDRQVDGSARVLVGLGGLAVAFRRRAPLATLAVSAVLTSAYLLAGYPYGPVFLPFMVAVYSAARYRPLRSSAPLAVGALVLLLTHLATHGAALPGALGLVPGTAWVAVPFAVGVTARANREAADRDRAETLRRHVTDERLRVAREVHDVVGHGLVAIRMQADLALHLLARRPEQAEKSLRAISTTSGEALDELRATLAEVRQDGASNPPGLDRLDELRARLADAGLDVQLTVTGTPAELPAPVGLAGYRVVQESLTNVLRHGTARRADVAIGYRNGELEITVANPIPRASAGEPAPGHGIAGMRHRVAALGGRLSAGPTDDGEFLVRAAIPTGGGSR